MRSFVDDLPAQLKADIIRISEENDGAFKVFQELYTHLSERSGDEDLKRRRLEETGPLTKVIPSTILFQLRELSFQSPLRKKLNLTMSISPSTQRPVLSVGKSNDDAPELVIDDLSAQNITFATFLPVAEKKNMLYFVIFYQSTTKSSVNGTDPIVLMMNKDTVLKQLVEDGKVKEGGDLVQFLIRQSAIAGMKIMDTFTPMTSSFFVESHRGTKEGILYFLPQHLLFGFKKPILLFGSNEIESISYSAITRITFTMTLTLKNGELYEFSMIDQQDFAQIDDYVKNRSVQDMSMSEALKEKVKSTSKSQQSEGALMEATQQLEEQHGGEEGDSDEDDDDYQVGKEVDDTSDASGEEDNSGVDDDDDDDDDDENDSDISDDGEELSGDAEIELNSDDD